MEVTILINTSPHLPVRQSSLSGRRHCENDDSWLIRTTFEPCANLHGWNNLTCFSSSLKSWGCFFIHKQESWCTLMGGMGISEGRGKERCLTIQPTLGHFQDLLFWTSLVTFKKSELSCESVCFLFLEYFLVGSFVYGWKFGFLKSNHLYDDL